jgi:hypothetical protein
MRCNLADTVAPWVRQAGTIQAFRSSALSQSLLDPIVILIAAGPPDECDNTIESLTQQVAEQQERWIRTFVLHFGSHFDLNAVAKAGSNAPIYLISSGNVADQIVRILDDFFAYTGSDG